MGTVRIVLRNGLVRAQVEEMCGRLDAMLGCSGVEAVVCEVREPGEPDMTVVEALMRLQLTARRRGQRVRLDDPPQALLDLLSLTGLLDFLNRPLPSDKDASASAQHSSQAEEHAEPEDAACGLDSPPRLSASAADRPPP